MTMKKPIATFVVTSKSNARAGSYTVTQTVTDVTNRKLKGTYPTTIVIN